MNNTPDNNKNSYKDYKLNGTPNHSRDSYRAERPSVPQQRPVQNPYGTQPSRQPRTQSMQQGRPMQPAQQRRPLNDEEHRRLEAARMAAMQNGGRMTEEEMRRRRQEQQLLTSAQPQANPERRVEIVNPSGTPNRAMPQNHAGSQNQSRKKKKKIRINAGAVIFVLLIAGVIGISAYQIQKNSEETDKMHDNYVVNDLLGDNEQEEIGGDLGQDEVPEETSDSQIPVEGDISGESAEDGTGEETPAEPNLTLYDSVIVSNRTLDEGDLILVNYEYAYADTDTVVLANVYNQRQSGIKVSSTAVSVTEQTLTALDQMLFDLTSETGCDDLLINSGHRNMADQQRIYDDYVVSNGPEYAQAYVAKAGYSEHHTGLACDLSFFTDDGYMVPIADHEFGYWLGENCMKYGFIRRYPEDKVEITKIAYEAWHFRYIGIPHAYACTALGQCLEEYIAALKNYTPETKLLHIKPDGTVSDVDVTALPATGGGWLTYYVPMTEGDTTSIKLLRGETYENYQISGNNADGYIVTVTLD